MIPKETLDIATAWLVRQDSRVLNAEEQDAFERWLRKDPIHAKAWKQVSSVWSDLDQLPVAVTATPVEDQACDAESSPLNASTLPSARANSGKKLWMGSAVLTASLAFFFMLSGGSLMLELTADAVTATGEMKSLTLPDGSLVHLNTASAVDVDFDDSDRTIHLLKGEAEFQVAHDASRPFRVEAAGGTATALGTAFIVRLNEGNATVTVLENTVEVAYPNPKKGTVERNILKPAQQVVFGPRKGLEAQPDVLLEESNAWRRGKLIFENKPLGEVIDELNRFYSGRIQILDASLAELKVNSVFSIEDPLLALDALESSLNLKSVRLGGMVIIYQ